MKVLKFKRPTASVSPPAQPISAIERKALEAALKIFGAALVAEDAEKLIQGKAIVAWPEGDSIRFGLVSALDNKSASTEVELLLSDEDKITVNEYPIAGFRRSGKTLTLATAALRECTVAELAAKAIDMDDADTKYECDCGDPECEGCDEADTKTFRESDRDRASNGRWTSGGGGSSDRSFHATYELAEKVDATNDRAALTKMRAEAELMMDDMLDDSSAYDKIDPKVVDNALEALTAAISKLDSKLKGQSEDDLEDEENDSVRDDYASDITKLAAEFEKGMDTPVSRSNTAMDQMAKLRSLEKRTRGIMDECEDEGYDEEAESCQVLLDKIGKARTNLNRNSKGKSKAHKA